MSLLHGDVRQILLPAIAVSLSRRLYIAEASPSNSFSSATFRRLTFPRDYVEIEWLTPPNREDRRSQHSSSASSVLKFRTTRRPCGWISPKFDATDSLGRVVARNIVKRNFNPVCVDDYF
jgi:hypothetical protein